MADKRPSWRDLNGGGYDGGYKTQKLKGNRHARFHRHTEGPNRLGLRELLERCANEQWVADHMTDELAAASVLTASSDHQVNRLGHDLLRPSKESAVPRVWA